MLKTKIASILGFLLLLPQIVLSAEFDPNYIISDEEMQDWKSMSKAEIQAFLNEKKGYIADMFIPDAEGKKRKAADIIYRTSREYKINPKYLLVKLQKEQSLITDPDPTQRQLDWAAGYGVCDSCSTKDDPQIQKYKGFGKQVDYAAGIIRYYYENVSSQNWIKKAQATYTIDNKQVVPVNLATAFLYTYTPHLHGNENFWTLWQNWFDQVYPDGTLLKSATKPTVYVILNGTKRAFSSMSALTTRYNPKLIITAPESELERYPTGPTISFPNYSILKNGEKYYLIDNETVRPFESYQVVKKLGLYQDEIIQATDSDIASYEIGETITENIFEPFGRLIKAKEDKQLYYLKDDKYYTVSDAGIAKANFQTTIEEKGSIKELQKYTNAGPLLFQNGTLIAAVDSNKVYVVENGKKRHIPIDLVDSLGYDRKNIIYVSEATLFEHPTGQPIYVRPSESPTASSAPNNSGNNSQNSSESAKKVVTAGDKTNFIGNPLNTDIDSYLIADPEKNVILLGKNIDAVRPMASLTKTITGYMLLKNGLSMNKINSYDLQKNNTEYNYYNLQPGEKVTNKNLLYAMLGSSQNLPTKMLVNNNGNNEDAFVKQMNDLVAGWGMQNTKFSDINGLDENTVTSASEYYKIFKQTLQNQIIKEYLGKKENIYKESVDKDGNTMHNDKHTNKLLFEQNLGYEIIASKADKSGENLAMLIERTKDNKQLIILIMGNYQKDNFTEADRIINLALNNF